MQAFSALAQLQQESETARLSAELFLRKALRMGCSLNYSLSECVTELNIDLQEEKIGKSRTVRDGIDTIVNHHLNLPITLHSLQEFLKKRVAAVGFLKSIELAEHPMMRRPWVCLHECIACMCIGASRKSCMAVSVHGCVHVWV